MKRTTAFLAAIAFCAVCSVYAEFSIQDKGTWPESWPKELEPLRKRSRTIQGPVVQLHYVIPFTNREDFESAWPHLLKVKNKGAPIILVRGPTTDILGVQPAGVLIYSPPTQSANTGTPVHGEPDARTKWMNANFIELVVDGEIVDLNRIPLPPDTPIFDERFKDGITK